VDIRVILFGIAASVFGYLAWRRGSRASSLVRGTATANIATAAKGFAEVQGIASAAVSGPLRDPITHQPCVWFAVETEKFSFDKFRWKPVKSATSSRPFVIDDDTGRCLVSPTDAEIDKRGENTIVKDAWNLRHKVWWIREGDPVYAIGYLRRADAATIGAMTAGNGDSASELVLMERATQILRAWKRDPRQLAKSDANRDGRIDDQEWEATRRAARAQAEADSKDRDVPRWNPDDAAPRADVTHLMSKPPDGRPFLLSAHGEASVVSRSRSRSFWGLVFFLIGVVTLLSVLHGCLGEAA
jgi:hypothetical protein